MDRGWGLWGDQKEAIWGSQFNCLVSEEQGGKGASGELYLTLVTDKFCISGVVLKSFK